ncbi:MAG: BamA/TamA family outer membrane protein [Xanthomonadaceae bacterium]|nr:BamA/TamA family outer membrane protein [Xanthomonadaceae bacterium]
MNLLKIFPTIIIALTSLSFAQETKIISGYQLSPAKNSFPGTSELLDKLDEKLKPVLNVEIGKEPSSDRLMNFKKTIENVINTTDRVGARVVDAQTMGMGGQQVMLQFSIDLGERVEFGFLGNNVYSKSDLQDLIDEQKQIGLGRDYVESIRKKIISFYVEKAFSKIKVSTRTLENPSIAERKIIYVIEEGERHRIGEIQFEGAVAITQETLKRKFYENAPPIIEKGYFSEKEIEKTSQNLVEWIRSQGYLSSKLLTVKSTVRENEAIVDLKIYINEGEQTIVRAIQVQGNSTFSQAEILQMLGLVEGAPLNVFMFNDGLEVVKLAYRNFGHLEFAFTNEGQPTVIQYSNKNRWADISIELNEGQRFKAGNITIEGNELTKDEVIKRELQFDEGEVLEERRLFESESRLRRLGIFSDVKTKTIQNPVHADVKDVVIQVQEASRGLASTGIGYRNDVGIRIFADLTYANLFKSNHTFGLGASVNRRLKNVENRVRDPVEGLDYEARMNYTWPWFLVPELSFRPEIVQRRFHYELFRDETTQLLMTFEKPIIRKWGLSAGLTYSIQRTAQTDAVSTSDNTLFTVGALTPSLTLDLRDSPLSPTKGFYGNISYEIASPALGSQAEFPAIAYNRILTRFDEFIPIMKFATLFLSVRTGFVRNLISPSSNPSDPLKVGVPLFKQFALGGINSVRGFQFQGINIGNKGNGSLTDFSIQGTLTYVNYRSQIDFALSESVKLGPFLDAANLLVDEFSFNRSMKFGAGIGLRYMTPIGPANFDWGFNLNPEFIPRTRQTESSNQFYFSLGII